MQIRNKFGLCYLQIKSRYEVLKNIAGRDPQRADFEKYDHALLSGIKRRYTTLNNFRLKIGVKPMTQAEYNEIPDISLIALLRKFAKDTGRLPRPTDFLRRKGIKDKQATIYNHFGSWSNALRVSGLK